MKKYYELDARMVEDVQRMLSIPLEVRAQIAEAEVAEAEEDEKQRKIDEMYENVGQRFWNRLERDGFIQRGVSYHKSYGLQRAGR
jgi:DNA-binding PadR family transcriptional regulator